MSSEIKVSSVKSKTGSNAITIADDGHIQNALTLDGGIANAGTISAGTIGGAVAMQSGLTLRNQEYKTVTAFTKSGTGSGGITTEFAIESYTYTPILGTLTGGSKIVFELQYTLNTDNASGPDVRTYIFFEISGSGITNFDWNAVKDTNAGLYGRSGSGIIERTMWHAKTAFFTTTTNDQITVNVKGKSISGSGNPVMHIKQSGSSYDQSYAKFMEFK